MHEQGRHMQNIEARTIEARRVQDRRASRRAATILAVVAPALVVPALVILSGCQVKQTEPPAPTGPSELGLSLDVRATPDVVQMDGLSQSQITITARDANSRPTSNIGVRVEITAGGEVVDLGRLSSKNVTTGGDGRATVTYTAPASPPAQNSDPLNIITLIATPAGYDYRSAVSRQVDIRLVPQGVILPIAFSPVPRFTFSPTNPDEDADVLFDASSSIPSCVPDPDAPNDVNRCRPAGGSIVSYFWDFGNGQTGTGMTPKTRYSIRGTYVVKLTVTNDRSLSNTTTASVQVSELGNPKAVFVFSPAGPAVNQTVFFDASASTGAGGGRTITDYQWNFGDGGSGGGITASHRYTRVGSFTATLTVSDNTGRKGTASQTVPVGEPRANGRFHDFADEHHCRSARLLRRHTLDGATGTNDHPLGMESR
jgi:chitodextrinase